MKRHIAKTNVTPVVMCTWKRVANLPQTIQALQQQQGVTIHLYLWNNNPTLRSQIDTIISHSDLPIDVIHSPENVGGFGRFYYARRLAKTYGHIIFIDDDQLLENTTIKTLWDEAKPQTISSWWAYNFLSHRNYWLRLPPQKGKSATYLGTCGMVADSSIFTDEELFTCPKEFWFIEDLWLSYFAHHVRGWHLYRSKARLSFLPDTKNQFVGLMSDKSRFLRYLHARGWSI